MKNSRAAIWAGLIIVLGISIGCHKAKRPRVTPPAGRNYQIFLRKVDGKCYITEKTLTIWLDDHPTVEWLSDDEETYTADFESGTPFKDGNGNPKKKIKTNEGRQAPKSKGEYYYSILDGSNNECIRASDPGVYIK